MLFFTFQEFYKPIMKAGLLNKEQLDAIFLNLDELIHVNKHFITKLKSAIHTANQNNDNVSMVYLLKGACLWNLVKSKTPSIKTIFLPVINECYNKELIKKCKYSSRSFLLLS